MADRIDNMPYDSALTRVVHRNITALVEERRKFEHQKRLTARVADAITRFTGSFKFVVIHAVLVAGWVLVNLGLIPGVKPWDRFPFVMLAMAASVEAIFLSTFVLISQNRMAELEDKRADLDLQVNLLAEHEITRLVRMVDAISTKLGIDGDSRPPDLEELEKDVAPEQVLDEIERVKRDNGGH